MIEGAHLLGDETGQCSATKPGRWRRTLSGRDPRV
jgi:hypothetical protein